MKINDNLKINFHFGVRNPSQIISWYTPCPPLTHPCHTHSPSYRTKHNWKWNCCGCFLTIMSMFYKVKLSSQHVQLPVFKQSALSKEILWIRYFRKTSSLFLLQLNKMLKSKKMSLMYNNLTVIKQCQEYHTYTHTSPV